jgi:hypothetical protein
MSNVSSILIVFRGVFTRIALGDADLRFSLMLIRQADAVEEKTKSTAWLYHQHNQSVHMTVGMTVRSVSANFIQKMCGHRLSMPDCVKLKIIL